MTQKRMLWLSISILIEFILILAPGCEKEENQTPVIFTLPVTGITQSTANCGGNLTWDGGATITSRGVCWSTSTSPATTDNHTVDGNGTGTFESHLTDLKPLTDYYIRAYATNSEGTGYGAEIRFKTIGLPAVTTEYMTNITPGTATGGGNVTSDGGATVTARGICWSTGEEPTLTDNKTNDGTGEGNFISHIAGLIPNTHYYVRAYATNSEGTSYGHIHQFITSSGTVTDIDNNTYNTITIGKQVWMRENLKTTKYNDGTFIPFVPGDGWQDDTCGAYCNYDLADGLVDIYGRLYNWYTISQGKNPCPAGWHLPTEEEWTRLVIDLGGENVAGAKMKEEGTMRWNFPNAYATNESGFTALPGGIRGYLDYAGESDFSGIGEIGQWWSSTSGGMFIKLCQGLISSFSRITIHNLSLHPMNG